MSTTIWPYTFSTGVLEPPTGNQLRLNAAHPYTTVTKLWARLLTNDNVDVYYGLMGVDLTSALYVQDTNDHTRVARFQLLTAPVDKVTYVEFAVAWVANSASGFTNNQTVQFVTTSPDVTPPAPGGQFLTLQQLKDHLRITTPPGDPGDPDLQAKLTQAQAHILGWCSTTPRAKSLADSWTTTTVPPVVVAAILIKAGELDRFRGDDPDAPPRQSGEELSVGIRELLRAYHDPVVA